MQSPQLRFTEIEPEIIVDLFAGGGGKSVGIEMVLGRSPDVAINHDPAAISMHMANHPQTQHYVSDVFEVCPHEATHGRPIGLLHLSPDCTHHSQAAGGQPRDKAIRALAWVGVRWAGQVSPRVITLENVKQIRKWGPLVAKRDKETGRVLRRDPDAVGGWAVAEPGERVPLQDQFLIPDPSREGKTWRRFLRVLQAMGYETDHFTLNAADFGAATTRDRLFMVARRDGKPIVRPTPTHYKNPARGQKRWRAVAEHIDWSINCPSIFTRKKPLAPATLRRIARGIHRYVIQSGDPFIVPITHRCDSDRSRSIADPIPVITTANRGELAIIAPTLIQAAHGEGSGKTKRRGSGAHDATAPCGTILAGGGGFALAAATLVQTGYGEREGQAPRALDIQQPMGVTPAGGQKHGLVTAFLEQANGGFYDGDGRDAREPASTFTGTCSQQRIVTAHLTTLRQNCVGRGADEAMPVITASAEHHGVVECTLSPEAEEGALRVAAFLMRYYGEGGQWGDPRDPAATITTKDRLALVTVTIRGTPYVIVDIGLRMLQPHELYGAQGFPPNYIIDRGHDGRKFTKSEQVRMVGNSVSPPPAAALIAANVQELAVRRTKCLAVA